jgi:hypothetical protein
LGADGLKSPIPLKFVGSGGCACFRHASFDFETYSIFPG